MHLSYIAFIDATKTRVNVEKEKLIIIDDSRFNRSFSLPANCDNNDNQSSSIVYQKPAVLDLIRPSISKIEQTVLTNLGKYHVQCIIASVLKIFLVS